MGPKTWKGMTLMHFEAARPEGRVPHLRAGRPGRGSPHQGAAPSGGSGTPRARSCRGRTWGSCTSSRPRACRCAGCVCGCSRRSSTCRGRQGRWRSSQERGPQTTALADTQAGLSAATACAPHGPWEAGSGPEAHPWGAFYLCGSRLSRIGGSGPTTSVPTDSGATWGQRRVSSAPSTRPAH